MIYTKEENIHDKEGMNYSSWQNSKDDIHQQHHQQPQQQQQHQNQQRNQHVQNLAFRAGQQQQQQTVNDKSSILDTNSPIDASNTDPALTSTISSSTSSSTSTKYNPKPISVTKRAEQNRNAQRAFRQRREKYMQDLELKVQELEEMKLKYQNLSNENIQLKDYVMILQRKIIELTQDKDNDHSSQQKQHHDTISNPFIPK
ncbi:kapC [Candida pseudojiufengensis]|uniref:kapC n=1 Tax=Candida pseudojiufengensis TaxID=497109 RepID=UPI002224E904|nr:kapC [Candida pseudojiufengensis]KAI5964761.1 kapC [Candida pseudojiufengensis]